MYIQEIAWRENFFKCIGVWVRVCEVFDAFPPSIISKHTYGICMRVLVCVCVCVPISCISLYC